jgi:dTDP-4-amino-4,6-dideoxygalactose transaminase
LEMLDVIAERRLEIYRNYRRLFEPLEAQGLLQLPHIPSNCTSNCHLFFILLPDRQTRDELMVELRNAGIYSVFHYIPLHNSPMGHKLGCGKVQLLVTDDLSGRLLRLPFYYEISEEEQQRVAEKISTFLSRERTRYRSVVAGEAKPDQAAA